MAPEDRGDELEEGYYVEGPDLGPGGFAIEEEVEELEAYGVSLDVEPLGTFLLACNLFIGKAACARSIPFLQILNASYTLLRIADHLSK